MADSTKSSDFPSAMSFVIHSFAFMSCVSGSDSSPPVEQDALREEAGSRLC